MVALSREYLGVELRWGPRLRDVDVLPEDQAQEVLAWLGRDPAEDAKMPVDWIWCWPRGVGEALLFLRDGATTVDRLYLVISRELISYAVMIAGDSICGQIKAGGMIAVEFAGVARDRFLADSSSEFWSCVQRIGLGRFAKLFD